MKQERNVLRLDTSECQRAEAELEKSHDKPEKQVGARANELARCNNLITALGRVAVRVNAASNPDSALTTLGAGLKQFDLNCFFSTLSSDDDKLTLRFVSLEPKLIALVENLVGLKLSGEFRIPRNYSLYHQDLVEQKQTLFMPDMIEGIVAGLSSSGQEFVRRFLKLVGISAETRAIYVPLIKEDQVVGILGLWGESLRESDCAAASILASQLAVALERAQLLSELRESETRYRTVSELISDYAYAIRVEPDRTPIWERLSGSFTQITGYSLDEVYEHGWLKVIYSDDLLIFLQHLEQLMAGQTTVSEYRIVTKSGQVHWLRDYGYPVLDKRGLVVYIYSAAQNITEGKQAEEAVRQAERRYRELFERAPLMYVLARNDQDNTLMVEDCNFLFSSMVCYSHEEIVGRPLADFYTPKSRAELLEGDNYRQALEGHFISLECQLLTSDGHVFETLCGIVPETNTNGQATGMRVMYVDISERKQAEEALQRYAARLETMHQIDLGILAAQSLEEIAQSAMGHVRNLIPCVRTSVTLYDFETAEESIVAVSFKNEETGLGAKRRLPLSAMQDVINLREGEHYLIEDISAQPTRSATDEQLLAEGVRSYLKLPLVYNGQLIGSFNLAGDEPNIFTAEHIDIAKEMADQLAIAIRSWQFLEENQRRLKELTLLVDASRAVSTTLEIETTLKIMVEQMTKALNVDECMVSTWEKAQDAVVTLMGVGWQGSELDNIYLLSDYPATRQVLITRQPLLVQISDPTADLAEVTLLKDHGIETSLLVPLVVRDQAIGLLKLGTIIERTYTPTEIDLCQTLANQMAAALENSRLFEQVQRHAKELEQRVAERTAELHSANQELQREIAERKLAEEALRKSEEEFRLIFELAPTGMAIATIEGVYLQVNRALCKLVGYSAEELMGQKSVVITHPDDVNSNLTLCEKLLRGEIPYFQMEKRHIHKNGRVINILLQVTLVRNSDGQPLHFIEQMVDITERKRAEGMLYHNAFHDTLTGLSNRALFREQLERAIEQANEQPDYFFAVLFIDLDRFKIINDSLGHMVGDRLLKTVAHRLEKCIRSRDEVARLGGDEFAILLDDPEGQDAVEHVADRIQQEVSLPIEIDGQQVFTTASIGIVLNTTTYQHPEELLRDADMAMYRAKSSGKARYELFKPAMHQEAMARLALEADLRRAIETQEFELYYQPIVSIASGQIVSLEALLRWHHPQRGLLPPKEFLPLAEETGLIMPLGEWALRTACLQVKSWRQIKSVSWPVAVNISVCHLQQPNLLELVEAILAEANLGPELLKLEVTESVAFKNIDHSIQILNHLRTMGVEISIDDFGTGYSSLSHLKHFPANTLKIDQSFIHSVIDNPNDGAIVAAIIAMAHRMGMTVVAEGVEMAEQLDFLRTHFCDRAQGYLFSQPLPAISLTELLKKGAEG